jgi:hypothetical protein
MSIGPMGGTPAAAAGLPLAQTKGGETDRVQQDLAAQQRQSYYAEMAAIAAGVGETDGENHETADRDAEGRLLWESSPEARRAGDNGPPKEMKSDGETGNLLDLTG